MYAYEWIQSIRFNCHVSRLWKRTPKIVLNCFVYMPFCNPTCGGRVLCQNTAQQTSSLAMRRGSICWAQFYALCVISAQLDQWITITTWTQQLQHPSPESFAEKVSCEPSLRSSTNRDKLQLWGPPTSVHPQIRLGPRLGSPQPHNHGSALPHRITSQVTMVWLGARQAFWVDSAQKCVCVCVCTFGLLLGHRHSCALFVLASEDFTMSFCTMDLLRQRVLFGIHMLSQCIPAAQSMCTKQESPQFAMAKKMPKEARRKRERHALGYPAY